MAENDARTKLLQAALPLFATKGFKAVSVKEIAREAGVNSALISYYFGSKDGLYRALMDSQFSKVQATLLQPELTELGPIERIERFILNFIELHRANPYIRRIMTSELNHPSHYFESLVPKYIGKFSRFLIETLEEGKQKGEFRADLNSTCAAASIVGMVNYYFLAEPVVLKFLEVSVQESWESFGPQAVQICLEGICCRPDR
ncbi:MAG: CerR family C-terminal domain-containing protein [Bacillota bacterium]|jgi:TetR/AcrR family transcriptional regulator